MSSEGKKELLPLPHELIRRIVRESPLRTALLWDDGSLPLKRWNYATVWEASTRIAKRLQSALPAPEQRGASVGVLLDDGPLLPVLQLSILRAGLVLVPLSPHEPLQRLQHVLDDARPALVVCHEADLERGVGDSLRGLQTILIEADACSKELEEATMADRHSWSPVDESSGLDQAVEGATRNTSTNRRQKPVECVMRLLSIRQATSATCFSPVDQPGDPRAASPPTERWVHTPARRTLLTA